MKVKLIIFDLDGTLIDTMGDYADKAAELIAALYPMDRDIARRNYLKTSGLPFRYQLEQLFPESAHNHALAERFERWKEGYLKRGGLLPPERRNLLLRLSKAGLKTAISSNNMQKHVSNLSQTWPIDAALGFRHDRFRKGEPHFHWIQQEFVIKKQEMLFVGDSPNDADIARAANIKFLALLTKFFVKSDFQKVDEDVHCLSNIDELLDFLPVKGGGGPVQDGRGRAK